MIQSSQALKNYINSPTRDNRQYIRAEIELDPTTTLTVSLNEMVNGSFSFNKQSVSGSYFDIGQAYIDNATFSVDRQYLEDNYDGDLANKIIKVFYGVHDLTDNQDEEIQIYTGIIPLQGVSRTLKTVAISIDSMLSLLDQPLDSLVSGTPAELLTYACNLVGLTISQRFTDILASHPNAQYTYYTTNATNIKTFLDLVMWIGQLFSGSVTCNNKGELDIVTYKTDADLLIMHPDIVKKSTTNDAEQYFDACTLKIDNTDIYYVGDATNQTVLRLDQNMLISELEDSLRDTVVDNIFSGIYEIPIRGFKYDYNGNPLLELGDRVEYKDITTYVECISYKFRGNSSISGYGIDPRISNSSSTQAVKSAATTGGGSGKAAQDNNVAALQYANAVTKNILYDKYNRVSDIYLYLYERTSLLINVTLVMELVNESTDYLDYIGIKQYYDDTELPVFIKESVSNTGYKTITFTCITPESEVYAKHKYSIDIMLKQHVATYTEGDIAGRIYTNQLEADLLVVVGLSGNPAVPPVNNYTDKVKVTFKKPTVFDIQVKEDEVVE